MIIWLIVETWDIGGSVRRDLLATKSVYGGSKYPAFKDESTANAFLESLEEKKFRKLRVIGLEVCDQA